jgi:hypothetical protein
MSVCGKARRRHADQWPHDHDWPRLRGKAGQPDLTGARIYQNVQDVLLTRCEQIGAIWDPRPEVPPVVETSLTNRAGLNSMRATWKGGRDWPAEIPTQLLATCESEHWNGGPGKRCFLGGMEEVSLS